MIERVLMTKELRGRGIDSDPYRRAMLFHYADSLQLICEYDEWLEEERTRIIQERVSEK